MSSKRILVRASIIFAFAGLVALSLRGPDRKSADLSLLMEPDGTGAWHEIIDDFQRHHPGVRVQLVEGPPATDVREDMYSTSFLSGAAAYDIVYCDVISVPKFAAAGWLLDLTDRIFPPDTEDFLAADLHAGMYQNRLYRIPAFTDSGILYYRKDLVSQPPETFDDLVRLSERFQSSDRYGFLWQGKQYEGLVTVYLEVLWGFGGDWIDGQTRQVLLDRPEALQALEFLRATIGTISPQAVTTYMEEDTRILFQNGRGIFLRNWPYVWTLLEQARREDARFAMTPVVHAPGHSSAATLGGWGFAVSRFTRNPDDAWEFVKFLTRPEQLSKIQSRLGRIPARRALVPAAFAPILNSARMRPPIPEYAEASDILQRWLSAALTGRTTSQDALSHAARETRLLLGE
jgi:multiple sugar transport system substrate-binding protein